MLTFTSFGSGSCGNCYYLGTPQESIIIDAGVGIRKIKKHFSEYGVNKANIKGILITHDHSDHIKSAGLLSDELNVHVYTTANIHEGLNRNYMMNHKVSLQHRVDVEEGAEFHLGGFTITPFSLPHDATENMGYYIKYGDVSFCVMTDLGAITENVNKYLSQSNYIVFESNYDVDMLRTGRYPEQLKDRIMSGEGHISNAQAAQAVAENFHPGVKNVWLCHLSEENNHPELARKTMETYLRSFGIIAGVDFKLEVLRRKVPTGPFYLPVGSDETV